MPESGSILDVVLLILTTGIGIGALASGAQNWLLRRLTGVERAAMLASGVLLLFPGLVDEVLPAVTTEHMLLAKAVGIGLFIVIVARQWMQKRNARVPARRVPPRPPGGAGAPPAGTSPH